MVIGHESAGVVAAVGEGVQGLAVGDNVALEGGIPCATSPWTLKGRYNLDPDLTFFATPPVHGSLASAVDHPAAWCHKLPEGVSLEEGAMCEPLSVGVHACRRAGVAPGVKVAIMGAGPIGAFRVQWCWCTTSQHALQRGFFCMQACNMLQFAVDLTLCAGLVTLLVAQAFGADAVAITDLKGDNLALATKLGATAAHCVQPGDSPADTAAALKAAVNAPHGFDVVIDCAGFESTMRTAIKAAVSGAKVVLVGMGQEEMTLPMAEASIREVDILGSFRYANTYPTCIALIASGRVNVKPLITHRFGFSPEGVAEGFATARDAAVTGAIKVMFNL